MLGKPVPDFSVPSAGGSTFRLSFARGTRLVLYFSPNEGFKAKMKFPFELFGVINIKNTYRRKVRDIERRTFVADEKRRVARQWRGVKVPGHVQEVMNFVKAL